MSEGVDALLNQLRMGTPPRRVAAAKALASCRTDEVVASLTACLHEKDWHLRAAAASSLALLLGIQAVGLLRPLLNDRAYGVREDVGKILHELGDTP